MSSKLRSPQRLILTCALRQLGRSVTLGPLEIAYAFQGPAFAGVTDTNGHVSDLVKAVGDTRIKYAEVVDEGGSKLAFKTT